MAKKGGKRDGSKGTAIAAALSANPSATAKQIQAIVAKGGVSVSLGMIAKVKGGLKASGGKKAPAKKAPAKKKKAAVKSKKAAAKAPAAKAAVAKAPAKKGAKRGRRPGGGASMSDAIREYITANPSASRSQVRDGLLGQGVPVKDSLVSAVYYKVRASSGKPAAKRGRPKKAAPVAAAPKASRAPAGELSAGQLLKAKDLADQLGGIAKVRQALELIEKLS